jgi:hypothetical protein
VRKAGSLSNNLRNLSFVPSCLAFLKLTEMGFVVATRFDIVTHSCRCQRLRVILVFFTFSRYRQVAAMINSLNPDKFTLLLTSLIQKLHDKVLFDAC